MVRPQISDHQSDGPVTQSRPGFARAFFGGGYQTYLKVLLGSNEADKCLFLLFPK